MRFLIIGGVNTAVGYGLFVAVQWLAGHRVSYFGSLLIAHLGASLLAFWMYRRWVFHVSGNALIDFLRFQLVYIVPLLTNLLALPLLVAGARVNVYVAQAAIVVSMTIVSYLGHRFFSFRRHLDPLGRASSAESSEAA